MLFIYARDSNTLKNRLPVTTLFMAIPLFILMNISQLNMGYASNDPITGEISENRTSCTLWLAILHLTAPTFFVYFFVRCAHVVLISKAHLAKYFIFQKVHTKDAMVWTHSKIEDLLRFINTHVASFLSPPQVENDKFDTYSVKSDISRLSFTDIKAKLVAFATAENQISFMGVLKSFLVVCFGEGLILIAALIINQDHIGVVQPCPITNYLAVIGLAFAGTLVLPWFILSVHNVKENYGIKFEMMCVSFEILIFIVLYIINLGLNHTESGIQFSVYFGSDLWILLLLLSLTTTCVLIPAIVGTKELFRARNINLEIKRSESEYLDMQQHFQSTMESPIHFEAFKKYLVADFAIENGLFYEQFLKYTRKYNMLQGGYTENDRVDLLNHLKKIYNDFVGSNATYELNLPMELKDDFKQAIATEKLETGLLNPIAREVSKMLLDNNFPRFYKEQIATLNNKL